jgi:hypothetical protein
MTTHTATFLYYKDNAGTVTATPVHAIVNLVQNGTDVDIVMTHGQNLTVPNTTVAALLENSGRKIRI